jgi:hypothetical protein
MFRFKPTDVETMFHMSLILASTSYARFSCPSHCACRMEQEKRWDPCALGYSESAQSHRVMYTMHAHMHNMVWDDCMHVMRADPLVRSECVAYRPRVWNVVCCYSYMEGSACLDPPLAAASDDGLQLGAQEDSPSNIAEALPLAAWPVIACKLNAFDLLRLSIVSCGLQRLLASIPGLWQQACNRHLSWLVQVRTRLARHGRHHHIITAYEAVVCLLACLQDAAALHEEWSHTVAAAAGTSAGQGAPMTPPQQQQAAAPWKCSTDAAGATILSAVCRLQQLCRRHRLTLRPMLFTPPPWLSAAPGRTRGLLPMAAGGSQLQPPLLLSPQQAYWLQLGCPIGEQQPKRTLAPSPTCNTTCIWYTRMVAW